MKLPKSQKGLSPLIAILLVVLVALAVGGYFFTQKGSSLPGQNQRNDFGCWPPSCSMISDSQGKQMCEDWKAGKNVQWPDCSIFSGQPNCKNLCESEKQGTATTVNKKQVFNALPPLVKAEFASDVTDKDKLSITQGISAMDFYLKKWFGKSIDQPLGLKVYATQSASLLEGGSIVMENGTAIIEIKTGSALWKQQREETRNNVSAHEYMHVYQLQNGCGNIAQANLKTPKWFLEGEAVLLSFNITKDAGWNPYFSIQQMISLAKQARGSLQSFEKAETVNDSNALSAYPLFATAVDYLIKERPIKTLDNFCVNLAKNQPVTTAFQNAFGIPLEKFYEEFEAYRSTW